MCFLCTVNLQAWRVPYIYADTMKEACWAGSHTNTPRRWNIKPHQEDETLSRWPGPTKSEKIVWDVDLKPLHKDYNWSTDHASKDLIPPHWHIFIKVWFTPNVCSSLFIKEYNLSFFMPGSGCCATHLADRVVLVGQESTPTHHKGETLPILCQDLCWGHCQ